MMSTNVGIFSPAIVDFLDADSLDWMKINGQNCTLNEAVQAHVFTFFEWRFNWTF